jgi:hypothetical protein
VPKKIVNRPKVEIPDDVFCLLNINADLEPHIEIRREEILERLADDIDPANALVWVWVGQAVDSILALELLARVRYQIVTLAKERHLSRQLQRVVRAAETGQNTAAARAESVLHYQVLGLTGEPDEKKARTETLTTENHAKRKRECEAMDKARDAAIARIKEESSRQEQDAVAADDWIDLYERLDRLRGEELKRLAGIMNLIEESSQGYFATRLADLRDEALDAGSAASLAPSPLSAAEPESSFAAQSSSGDTTETTEVTDELAPLAPV